MAMIPVPNAGALGVNKDLSAHELPLGVWTDALNVRFLDGMASQFLGHGQVYNDPPEIPQHVLPVNVLGKRYWLYTTAAKTFVVTITASIAVHTDITHLVPRAGVVNQWTSTLLAGIPVLNVGDTLKIPMYWDLNVADKCLDLPNWPANTYCKSLRSYRNYLIALNITDARGNLPYMIKWSSPADPGSLPLTWDPSDATQDAGEQNLAEGYDIIVDGLQLRDAFIVYKEASVWRLTPSGNNFIFNIAKVLGTSGALNRNCIVELDGVHVVLSGSDVVVHDGQSATSVLDKQTRRSFFQSIDTEGVGLCFVFKNPFFNEVFICYPSLGSSVCDRAMVWNYVDKTVSFREMPAVNHAAFGPVDNGLSGSWDSDPAPWDSDLTAWNGPDYVPSTTRTLLASANKKLYTMDVSAAFDGQLPNAFIERRGLTLGADDRLKLVRGVRPRITGTVGQIVNIQVGASDDPYADPVYGPTMQHIIGETLHDDCYISGRYIAVRFSTNNSFVWRLDSYDLDVVDDGEY